MKGATTTIHYIPILAVTALSGILMLMLTSKLGVFISNPELFLGQSIEAAARDVALVCDGKLTKKDFSPPPPGASYLVMNCQDRINSKAVSDVILASQLVSAGRDIADAVKNTRKGADATIKVGEEMSNVLRTRGAVTHSTEIVEETGEVIQIIELTDEAADTLSTLGKQGEGAIEDMSDARRGAEDAAGAGQEAQSTSTTSAKKEEQAMESAQDLQTLDDLPRENGKVRINCAEQKQLCDSIQYGYIRMISAGEAAKAAAKAFDATLETGEALEDASASARRSVKNRVISGRYRGAGDFASDALRGFRRKTGLVGPTREFTSLWHVAKDTRKTLVRNRGVFVADPTYLQLSTGFLDGRPEFYDTLTSQFVGIKYTPTMVNVVNFTSEEEKNELVNIFEKSLNSTGAAMQLASAISQNVASEITDTGYFETINYLETFSPADLAVTNRDVNIDPSVYIVATGEFALKASPQCETEECTTFLYDLVNYSFGLSTDDISVDDLLSRAGTYGGGEISQEFDFYVRVINYLNKVNALFEPISGELSKVQTETASWLKSNCETYSISYPSGPIEVAVCGMVVDCSPGDFCYMGIPVVDAEPWIPYIPVGVIDEENVETISNIIGLNYNSYDRIVDPGMYSGCGGYGILSGVFSGDTYKGLLETAGANLDVPEDHKAYVCVMTSASQRCRVISCDKYVRVKPDNFVPTPFVEDKDDEIFIGGNFATW